MVDILIAVVFSALRDKYSIEGHEEWITELDSSTEGGSILSVWFK
jgi:DNA-directed primase/polymerase protein